MFLVSHQSGIIRYRDFLRDMPVVAIKYNGSIDGIYFLLSAIKNVCNAKFSNTIFV